MSDLLSGAATAEQLHGCSTVVCRVVCKKEVTMVCETHHFHNPRNTAMATGTKRKSATIELKALLGKDEDKLRRLLEQEMTDIEVGGARRAHHRLRWATTRTAS